MTQTHSRYRLALGWRIFMWIVLPPMLAGSIGAGVMPFFQEEFSWVLVAIMVPIGLGLALLCLYGIADMIVGYYEITDVHITHKFPTGTRTLLFSEIKGMTQDKNYIYLIPKDSAKKKIRISTYTGKHNELFDWLSTKFDDLNILEALREEERILANDEYGTTQQAREARLADARRWAKYVNAAGIGALLWTFFYPQPYVASIAVNMLLPFVALLIVFLFRGLIRLDGRTGSAYPDVTLGVVMPGLGLFARALLDFNILEYSAIWKYVVMLTVSMFVLLYLATNEFNIKSTRDKLTMASFGLFMAIYSLGVLFLINCRFDKSEPQVFDAPIVDKSFTSGSKSTTYHLKLAPWGPRSEAENVSVTKDEYAVAEVDDVVNVYLHKGVLGTPWFWVELE